MSCLHNRPGFLYSLPLFSSSLQVDMFAQIVKMSYLPKIISPCLTTQKHCTSFVQCFNYIIYISYCKLVIQTYCIHTFRQITESASIFSSAHSCLPLQTFARANSGFRYPSCALFRNRRDPDWSGRQYQAAPYLSAFAPGSPCGTFRAVSRTSSGKPWRK